MKLLLCLLIFILLSSTVADMPIAIGFPSDYTCSGRIFDEPRRYRLKCMKNSNRKMNCSCGETGNSRLMSCKCDHVKADAPPLSELPIMDVPLAERVRDLIENTIID